MPPLEALAEAMVQELNNSELTPEFIARWDYLPDFNVEEFSSQDPIDVLFVVKSESTKVLSRVQLETQLDIQVAIRKRVDATDKATISAIRELCESIHYYWAPPRNRRIAAVQKVWLETVVDMAYSPDDLKQHLFYSVATLSFGITR